MNEEQVACVVHEACSAFRQTIGQGAHPPWDEAPKWMREATRVAVRDGWGGKEQDPRVQHQLWLDHKRAEGWIYGADRDDDAKVHPLMVPYDDLPEEERQKDALVAAIIRALTVPMDPTVLPS